MQGLSHAHADVRVVTTRLTQLSARVGIELTRGKHWHYGNISLREEI